MSNITISNLSPTSGNIAQYLIADDGLSTYKIRTSTLLSFADGISGSGGYIECNDSGTHLSVSGHYIPITNSDYDLGSAEYKIRHLFLSSNSLYMGDSPASSGNKISVSNDEIIFTNTDESTSKPCLIPDTIPASSVSNGKLGQIALDDNYFYVCWQSNQWKRLPLTSFETF